MPLHGKGMLIVYNEVKPRHERDFNEWYNREHIDERVNLPGFHRARRYVAVRASPKYLATYECDTVSDLADPGYLALLGQVHQLTRQDGKQLSVSVPPAELAGGLHSVTPGLWWTSAYLRSVADRVDQVAIMTYDISMAPTSGVYSGYVHRETEVALRAVPADVTLLIGVPAYQTTGVWLISGSENVAAGIRGVRLAISPDPPDRPLGVALYVDFTATAQDWASYQQDWVK